LVKEDGENVEQIGKNPEREQPCELSLQGGIWDDDVLHLVKFIGCDG
jgi:hypothetical protein